ncbi:MAG: aldo/keto reductase [Bryobacteraceae bacterium]|jgi:aryl-alcohol dehydrogenase-like predicted oxidoreductase
MKISRRHFLEGTALSGVVGTAFAQAVDTRTGMPTRILGRTGFRASILAFGGGSGFYEDYKTDEEGIAALSHALDLGINYIDTAATYGGGLSETRIGKTIKGRRQGLFIATKLDNRKGDDAMREFEGSLKRLQLDQVDLVHVHAFSTDADLAALAAKDSVVNALYKLRDQKATRFIGITSHTRPSLLKTALERYDFDCTQMALNAARAGWGRNVPSVTAESFEDVVIPVALRKNMGITAMKVLARNNLPGKAPMEKLLHYPMSLKIAAAVVAMPSLKIIEENVSIAKNFRPMSRDEMNRLSTTLSAQYKASLDAMFEKHLDC